MRRAWRVVLESIVGLGCSALLACSTPPPPVSMLESDPEAQQIYAELAASKLLPDEAPRSDGVGLSPTWSRVWLALQALAGSSGEERQRAREKLTRALATTGYTSEVCFRTPTPGAEIFVQSISTRRPVPIGYTNSREAYPLTLGLYQVWAERDGAVTDRRENQPITRRSVVIDLEGDASQIADCR